ncbi:CaiB/BaiF CoA transferase family protein [Sciscionella sediminilitoris]|uniref:CaiB/BaiF CoA transferase family protein n=1 Tax=Sciscionella sediminilitoris TaxID=1445613 RepID=UPI00055AC625|nr:CoA transferase [Sciscionella sp. SE31]
MSAPLSGVRVADLSRVLSGPYATMLLADLGAEVIKVEQPGRGDDTRAWSPPEAGGESSYYLSLNRGKRSLAIDLASPEGHARALRLCAEADIVVQNFRPGTADRLGLGFADVAAVNPDVVYCSVSAYPDGHPEEGQPGFDVVLQAESGFMAITGEPEGEPVKVGVAIVDVLTALNTSTAMLAGLHKVARTGAAEHIRVSMLGSALSGLVNVAQAALVTGTEPERYGNEHPSVVPYQPFQAADGKVLIAAGNDALFGKLCELLGRADLAEDPRYASNALRVTNRETLLPALAGRIVEWPAEKLVDALRTAGVPAGNIRGVLDALRHGGSSVTAQLEHPTAGTLTMPRPGFRFTGSETFAPLPPPFLGEHTDAEQEQE